MIKVNTTNLRYYCKEEKIENNFENRFSRLKKYFKQIDADLFGFQEFTVEMNKDIISCFKNKYGRCFHGRIKKDDEATPIFYKKDKIEIIKKGHFFLNEHPDKPGISWDSACPRVCTYLIARDKTANKKFIYCNTHLDHIGEIARQKSIQLIIDYFKKENLPIILTGDFNVYENTPTYNTACKYLNDSKYIAKKMHGGSSFHGFSKIPFDENGSPIDFCFVSKEMNVLSYNIENYKIDNKDYSDHYGITCLLDF